MRQYTEEMIWQHGTNWLWISVNEEYALSGNVLRILSLFETSYLCEAGVSAVTMIKSKYYVKIDV